VTDTATPRQLAQEIKNIAEFQWDAKGSDSALRLRILVLTRRLLEALPEEPV
jgi:hypothetical protein